MLKCKEMKSIQPRHALGVLCVLYVTSLIACLRACCDVSLLGASWTAWRRGAWGERDCALPCQPIRRRARLSTGCLSHSLD